MAAMRGYFSLNGRSSRREWWAVELLIVAAFKLNNLALTHVLRDGDGDVFAGTSRLWLVGIVALLWLNFASNVRRLHDRGKSGWWSLLYLFPGLGQVWCIIECGLMEGQAGANRYGPAPAIAALQRRLARKNPELRAAMAAETRPAPQGFGRRTASPAPAHRPTIATQRPTVARAGGATFRLPRSRKLRTALALGAALVIGLVTLAFTTGIPVPVAVVPASINPDLPAFSGTRAAPSE